MPLKEKTRFAIIDFEEYLLPDGKKATELVPKSWLHETSPGVWFCAYPPEQDYGKIVKWVKEEKPPEEEWVQFSIALLSEASKYNLKIICFNTFKYFTLYFNSFE